MAKRYKKRAAAAPGPLVSVIVPCRDAAATLAGTISGLLRQQYRHLEIILVDDASVDGTTRLIKRAVARRPRLIKGVYLAKSRSAGGARNAALKKARGEFIAFTDADTVPAADWLSRLVELMLSSADLAAAAGSVVNGACSLFGWADYFLTFSQVVPSLPPREVSIAATVNAIYRRAAIQGMRFVETNFAEDAIFGLQLRKRGGRLRFHPRARVVHVPQRNSWRDFRDKQLVMGNGFHYSRTRYPFANRWLLRHAWLFLCLPRLWIIAGRMCLTRYFPLFLLTLPLVAAGEVLRTSQLFRLLWRERGVAKGGKSR